MPVSPAPAYAVHAARLLHVAPGLCVRSGTRQFVVWLDVGGNSEKFALPPADALELMSRLADCIEAADTDEDDDA